MISELAWSIDIFVPSRNVTESVTLELSIKSTLAPLLSGEVAIV